MSMHSNSIQQVLFRTLREAMSGDASPQRVEFSPSTGMGPTAKMTTTRDDELFPQRRRWALLSEDAMGVGIAKGLWVEFLESCDPGARNEWMMRIWCPKEAASKALGKRLIDRTRSAEGGAYGSKYGDRKAAAFPQL